MTSLAPADELVDPFARPRGLVWTDGVQAPFVAIEKTGGWPRCERNPADRTMSSRLLDAEMTMNALEAQMLMRNPGLTFPGMAFAKPRNLGSRFRRLDTQAERR